jgi:hypothetical protein
MPEVWSIASVVLLDGRIALVATGDAAEAGDPARPGVWWLTQETAGQVGWNGDWQYAGLPAPGLRGGRAVPRIAAAGKGDGGLAAAVCADDAAIWYAWQEKPDNSWSAWYSLATPPVAGTTSPSDPVLVLDGRGRLAGVLGPHPPPELASFARRIEDPVLSVDADGHLVATFRVTGSTNVYWLRQQEVNGDLWLEGVHRAAPPAG